MIYDLLEFPPFSDASLGLVLSCKLAYEETSVAAARKLNRFLKDTEANAAKVKKLFEKYPGVGGRHAKKNNSQIRASATRDP